jgi:hypothetical protein
LAGAILGGERRGRAFHVEPRARTASSAQESEMSPSSPTRRPAENAAMGASPTDVEAPRPRTARCSSPAGRSGARVATARSLRSRESPFSRGMRAACGGDVKVEPGAARSGADDRMLTRKYLGEARPNGQSILSIYAATPTEVALVHAPHATSTTGTRGTTPSRASSAGPRRRSKNSAYYAPGTAHIRPASSPLALIPVTS